MSELKFKNGNGEIETQPGGVKFSTCAGYKGRGGESKLVQIVQPVTIPYVKRKIALGGFELKAKGTKGNRVFYLSTPPTAFPVILQKLQQHGLD